MSVPILDREQKRTMKWCLILSILPLLWIVGMLINEGFGVAAGHHASISELFWLMWAHQPGPIAIAFAILTFIVGVFCGHFLWQSNTVYDALRGQGYMALLKSALDALKWVTKSDDFAPGGKLYEGWQAVVVPVMKTLSDAIAGE